MQEFSERHLNKDGWEMSIQDEGRGRMGNAYYGLDLRSHKACDAPDRIIFQKVL